MTTALDPTVGDQIIRARHTLMEILRDRGYDPSAYENIAPDQIVALAKGASTLDMVAPKRPDSSAPCERAVVLFLLLDKGVAGRCSTGTFYRDIFEEKGRDVKRTDDILVIINEPYKPVFDTTSLLLLQQKSKIRMTFFHLKQVIVHLGRHRDVPPHRKLSDEEKEALMRDYHVRERAQLPLIKHSDIQARLLGLVPGDVVEILRPSPTAGEIRYWRLCAA